MTFDPDLVRLALTEAERRSLHEEELRGKSSELSFASRAIADLTVQGLAWSDSWAQAHVERVLFRDCRFHGHDLSSARFRAVTFERCSFERCRYGEAIFDACRFIACELRDGSVRGAALQECDFIDTSLEGLTLYGVRVDGVRLTGGRMASVRYSESELSRLELSGMTLDDVRLTLCQAGRLVLTNCAVRDLVLLGGAYGIVELSGGTLSNSGVAEATVGELRLAGVRDAVRFRMNGSRVEALAFAGCSMSDLYLCSSGIMRLEISGGSYRGWITKCKLHAGRIAEATLIASFWDETEATDLSFSGVTFERFVCARQARFIRMRLSGARYAPGFELVSDDTTFEQSDGFAGRAQHESSHD